MEDVKIVVDRRYDPDPIDYERFVALVEATGERVVITEGTVPMSVLLPAAVVAEQEHWARATYPWPDTSVPQEAEWNTDATEGEESDDAEDPSEERDDGRVRAEPLADPQEFGPYVRYVRADGARVTFTRGGAAVAVQLAAEEAAWLAEKAKHARQGYMSPQQAAAFREFLARQPPIDKQ